MFNRCNDLYLVSSTKPELACAVCQIFQFKTSDATEEDFKCIYNLFKHNREDRFEFLYGGSDLVTAEANVLTGVTYATSGDISSQLSVIVLFVDHN